MSHVAVMEGINILDLDALEVACAGLGLELLRGQTTYAWWGYSVGDSPLPAGMKVEDLGTCHHAIRVKGTVPANGTGGPWEIGLWPNAQGGYSPVCDYFGAAGQALMKVVGENGGALAQAYNSEVILRELARQGCRVESVIGADGTRRITAVQA